VPVPITRRPTLAQRIRDIAARATRTARTASAASAASAATAGRAATAATAAGAVGAARAARVARATRCAPLLAALLLSAGALLAAPATADAHQLGLTRVTVTFTPERTYVVEILVDPESLLAKLQILANQEPSGPVPLDELPSRIAALQQLLLANTRIAFDGTPAQPSFTYVPGPPAGGASSPAAPVPGSSAAASPAALRPENAGSEGGSPPAMIPQGESGAGGVRGSAAVAASTAIVRLTGQVPGGARAFRFGYGLVLGSFPLTISGQAGSSQTVWLAGGQESEAFDLTNGFVPPSRLQVAMRYLVLGFEHIVPKGVDHILFVLGIFLLSTAWRPILLQVTTFTIAHSITLGLTIYGFVSLPSSIVEPLIALSITYVAVENLFTSTLRPWRIGLVFAFGLLHGMGFAGVLKDLGLPRSEFLTALVTFNVGVEAGQLTVIAMALVAVGWWRRSEATRYRRWIVVPASLLIAAVGAYWTVIRAIG